GIHLPADQLFAIVTALLTARYAEGPRFERNHHTGEHTELQRAVVDRLHGALLTMLPRHRLPPALRAPCQWSPRCGVVVLPTDRQPCCPCPALVSHQGNSLLQGRISTGGGGL